MAHDFEDVVEHLRAHAGDALKAVVVYDGDKHRDLYRHEDLRDLHGSELEREVLSEVRADEHRRTTEAADEYEGDLRATVRVFDERVIVHLPRDDETGTVVVMDPVVARDLADFVADVRGALYGE